MKIKLLFLSLVFIVVSLFFKDFILQNKLPIPSDTIVGLYYPYKDLYTKEYPRGVPFKNFMITDPIRQQIPWKNLSIDLLKKGELPLWNPYTFAGQPLLANFQSGAFYPFNIVFFILSFPYAWSVFIILQSILSLIFTFLYLNNLKLDKRASFFGALAFAFGGFSISWLEWGNVIHTALWLPLILLSIDKTLYEFQISPARNASASVAGGNFKFQIPNLKWPLIFLASLLFSFFAGHLQIFFYCLVFSLVYLLAKIIDSKNKLKKISAFLLVFISFIFFSAIVWIPALKFILLSGRNIDQDWHTIEGWFVPYQNLIQLIIPDFFGNPATLNYWGIFNYGEFVSYLGVGALIFSIFAIFRKDKKTLFFASAVIVALLFALPTIIAKIPFKFSFPFLSSAQPTRLIFIVDFSLSVLAALGFDYFLKTNKKKNIYFILGILLFIFVAVWIFVLKFAANVPIQNLAVTKNNLILPSILFFINAILILIIILFPNKIKYSKKLFSLVSIFIIVVLLFDLFRFGWKYLPFTHQQYLYPSTKVIEFLKQNTGNYRIMSTDSRIFPPNFSIMHKIQSVDGYDPLYLDRYAQLIAALQRNEPNINPPFGFNRIITPQNYHSRLISLLGVKYVLSLEELSEEHLKKLFSDGETKVYENIKVLPRAFFVRATFSTYSKQDSINFLFKNLNDLRTNAVIENSKLPQKEWSWTNATVKIKKYSENRIEIETENDGDGFLVLTDTFYPSWNTTVDNKETKIYLTDYNFRGIIVPKGKHKIIFYNNLF